jgi:hypothetical protein
MGGKLGLLRQHAAESAFSTSQIAMMESNPFRVCPGLLFDLVEDECLEQLTEQLPLVVEFGCAAAW